MKQEQDCIKLKRLALIGCGIGVLMVLLGVMMNVFDLTLFGLSFPNIKSAPWGFILIGVLLIIVSIAPYVEEIHKTKQQRIEDHDERNLLILYRSSYYAFSFLMGFGGLILLFLTMLGYMNKVSFFVLCSVFILSYVIFLIVQYNLHKSL